MGSEHFMKCMLLLITWLLNVVILGGSARPKDDYVLRNLKLEIVYSCVYCGVCLCVCVVLT